MKNDPPAFTHEEISRKAYALWEKRGRPDGFSDTIWLDAESQLRAEARDREGESRRSKAEPVVRAGEDRDESRVEAQNGAKAVAPTTVDHRSITTELQKHEARAPQVPHHTGPKSKPAETGKPVWPKAHGA